MRFSRAAVLVTAVVVLGALALLLGPRLAGSLAAARLRHAAAERGLDAHWRSLGITAGGRLRIAGLTLTRAPGDTVLAADSLGVTLDRVALLTLRVAPAAVTLAHARIRLRGTAPAVDTLADEEAVAPSRGRAERLRSVADGIVRTLLLPARQMPAVALRDVQMSSAGSDETAPRTVRLQWLELEPHAGGVWLSGAGVIASEQEIPFWIGARYGADDRLRGGASFALPDSVTGADTLRVSVDGRLHQDRRARRLRLQGTVWIGRLPITVGGELAEQGPAAQVALAADNLTAPAILASVPRAVLGPLTGLAVTGSFDWRLTVALDLAHPDSVDFDAAVIPHGLALDPAHSSLDLLALHGPFEAAIHLPHDRIVHRELSDANPCYRPLDRIDPRLVYAVVTNEDGGFFRHRGFNVEAIKNATAENLKAGGYRRGAGTITMQLARNLWLGHRRTLSRKAQEVVLAWVLEHLTGLSKERLLEIYLNIIEWGPDVHGACEATRFYFDEDPSAVSVDEALFLTTLVPSPGRWRGRFAPDGSLRRWTRAQMHFIGRAMTYRGWLDPAVLPPTDSMRVTVRGPARAFLPHPAGPPSAPADTAAAGVQALAPTPPR
ncbi:MAG TPA: biosynthetic peptidoglycan transglycosylase [Candidatus Eisenbacteria bacterium]|nr:biosynthetic peptidoglycan transglycosylase [Candidatus Eisenbacteria bacterium]